MAETGAVFGGEHSGHFYFRDFWRADSGMLAALHAIAALGETADGHHAVGAAGPLSSATSPAARSTPGQPTWPRPRRGSAPPSQAEPGVAFDDLDGMTVTGPDWWFNVRPSNTEPLLRLNAEARDEPHDGRAAGPGAGADP